MEGQLNVSKRDKGWKKVINLPHLPPGSIFPPWHVMNDVSSTRTLGQGFKSQEEAAKTTLEKEGSFLQEEW